MNTAQDDRPRNVEEGIYSFVVFNSESGECWSRPPSRKTFRKVKQQRQNGCLGYDGQPHRGEPTQLLLRPRR